MISSQTITSGSAARARAIRPVGVGLRKARAGTGPRIGRQPDGVEQRLHLAAWPRCGSSRAEHRGWAGPAIWPTLWRGFSASVGLWKTIWIRRRCSRVRFRAVFGQRFAVEQDLAGPGGMQPRDHACDRRLAAARLTDEGNAFATAQMRTRYRRRRRRCRCAFCVRHADRPLRARSKAPPDPRRPVGADRRRVPSRRWGCAATPCSAPHGCVSCRSNCGSVVSHDSTFISQRGPNGQPGGRSPNRRAHPAYVEGWAHGVVGGGRQQATRVRVRRPSQHFLGGPLLHDVSAVDHHDPVGDLRRDREVVRDVQHRHAAARHAAEATR